MYLAPGHPIIAIRTNRNQNGRRIGKKVCKRSLSFATTMEAEKRDSGNEVTAISILYFIIPR